MNEMIDQRQSLERESGCAYSSCDTNNVDHDRFSAVGFARRRRRTAGRCSGCRSERSTSLGTCILGGLVCLLDVGGIGAVLGDARGREVHEDGILAITGSFSRSTFTHICTLSQTGYRTIWVPIRTGEKLVGGRDGGNQRSDKEAEEGAHFGSVELEISKGG